jgi:hypothetical protein
MRLCTVFVLVIVAAGALASPPNAEPCPARRSLEKWKSQFGERGYRLEYDEVRRFLYFSALPEREHRAMRATLERQADHLAATLFDGPPDYDTLIIIPRHAHAMRIFDTPNVAGRYDHDQRRLIARDAGSALRHEFFHLMHYGHMERLGVPHAWWVQEGLAALYEDYELDEDGAITFLPNERTIVMRNRLRSSRVLPWPELFEMPAERFMARATVLYPQARSMFRFTAAQGRLESWYRAYVEHFDDDRTGVKAFEVVFGEALEEIERQWRQWAMETPGVPGRQTSSPPARDGH